MADIELVIKIPEERYKEIVESDKPVMIYRSDVEKVLANGIQLPKGHGRLIDADALMEYCQNDKSKVIDCNDIARFPTIIRRE